MCSNGPAAASLGGAGWHVNAVPLPLHAQVQLPACQLLVAICSKAPPELAKRLCAEDLCEHLFEVARSSTPSLSAAAQQLLAPADGEAAGAAGGQLSYQEVEELRSQLQCSAVTALRYLSYQGECPHCQRAVDAALAAPRKHGTRQHSTVLHVQWPLRPACVVIHHTW
jgi:hypothetical protein